MQTYQGPIYDGSNGQGVIYPTNDMGMASSTDPKMINNQNLMNGIQAIRQGGSGLNSTTNAFGKNTRPHSHNRMNVV